MKRKERFSYPLPALRETLLNAVVHRDYTNPSDIQIKVFDDRITFFSPGKLYGGLKIEDLYTDNYQSHLRNKLVAEAFYLTKNIEKYGSGFIRIRKELESYQEVRFSVEEVGDGILVTFSTTSGAGVSGGVNGGVSGGVSGRARSVLDYISQHPGVKTHDLVADLGISERTIQRLLKNLKDERIVEFRGAPKTGGYYLTKQRQGG